ncbi:MAG: STAS domain-containing protein [Planctomycetes bacterium]|nr:STAS domain-containing protein [Planctomycetota bacterium]MBI3836214.1 STAS domain-containing protein [Planctomycetota bacterium]
MGIEVERKGSVATAKLNGVLNAETADATSNALAEIAFEPDARVIIDLSGLHYLDSSGLSVLIHTVTRSRMSGGRVLLLSPTPFVRGIFDVTRLNTFFEIVDDAAAAEAALSND